MKKQIHKQKQFLLSFALPVLLLAVFFVFSNFTIAQDKKVVIHEVMFNPVGSDNKENENSYEFVILKNISNESIYLAEWDIRIGTYFSLDKLTALIPANAQVVIFSGVGEDKNLNFAEGKTAYLYRNKNGSQIGDSKGEIFLYSSQRHNAATLVDYVEYGKNEGPPFALEGCSIKLEDNFSHWVENCPEQTDNSDVADGCIKGIVINEIFPFTEEFIEVVNTGENDCNLKGWSITDSVGYDPQDEILKNKDWTFHRKEFGDVNIESGGLAVIEGNLNLNNDEDTVKLFNPNKEKIQSIEYDDTVEGLSYCFSNDKWKWSSRTKGNENVFTNANKNDNLEIDRNIYVNVYANFKILGLNKKDKVVWNFGDGRKSYKQDTKHKYLEEGYHEGSLKINGDAANIQQFTVEVKEFPEKKVKIVGVNANPKGKDTEFESITLENKSKKKVNLKGWSIATGWKKLINHPITEDFEIKAGKMKEITREFSKFSLNNKQLKIELRYPDGEVASHVKYDLDKSVAEGARYVKEGKEWKWKTATQSPNDKIQMSNKIQISNVQMNKSIENVQREPAQKDEVHINQTILERENKLKELEILQIEEKVLGAETVRELDGQYMFTPTAKEREHYAAIFIKNISSNINEKINSLLNYLFN